MDNWQGKLGELKRYLKKPDWQFKPGGKSGIEIDAKTVGRQNLVEIANPGRQRRRHARRELDRWRIRRERLRRRFGRRRRPGIGNHYVFQPVIRRGESNRRS